MDDVPSADPPPTDGGKGSLIAAGHLPPSPKSLDDISIAHAIDGDGTAFCQPHMVLEQIDKCYWHEIPVDQRCLICLAIVDR